MTAAQCSLNTTTVVTVFRPISSARSSYHSTYFYNAIGSNQAAMGNCGRLRWKPVWSGLPLEHHICGSSTRPSLRKESEGVVREFLPLHQLRFFYPLISSNVLPCEERMNWSIYKTKVELGAIIIKELENLPRDSVNNSYTKVLRTATLSKLLTPSHNLVDIFWIVILCLFYPLVQLPNLARRCMYIHVRAKFIRTHTHTYMHTYVRACVYMCMYVFVCVTFFRFYFL